MDKIGWFEKSVQIADKYGTLKICKAIVFVSVFIFMVVYIPAITKLTIEKVTIESIETADKNKEREHIENLEKRKEIQPQIYGVLNSMLNSVNSDRAFIIELHNGSNNLNGVPFLHGSVTYEKSRENLELIDEEYQNLSLSRFDFSTYLHYNYSFIGSIEELMMIDKKLANKLITHGVKYLAITSLHNGINEWGWVGVIYNSDERVPLKNDIMKELMIKSQNISNILNVLKE